MKLGVVTFPGSNDDHDALRVGEVIGAPAVSLWHKDTNLQGSDVVVVPGGFSYGDYLRCGAIARFSPILKSVRAFADAGGLVVGICNGFQILCEAGLLPGALIRNPSLSFICEDASLRVENASTAFTSRCRERERLTIPIKHGEGCYFADEKTIEELESNRQVLFRYVNAAGEPTPESCPNGSLHSIAGIMNHGGNVFGMMPHPEHAVEKLLGSEDGLKLFLSLVDAVGAGRTTRASA